MKAILKTALALSLLGGTTAMAQPDALPHASQNDNRDQRDNNRPDRRDGKSDDKKASDQKPADKKPAELNAVQQGPAQVSKERPANDRSIAGDKTNNHRAGDQRVPDQGNVNRYTNDRVMDDRRGNDQRDMQNPWNTTNTRAATPRWSRGERLPDQYWQDRYYVNDWQQRGLNRPPRGYRWVRNENDDFFLAAISTGIITMAIYRDDRENRWNRRYSHAYSYNDDIYYRECRNGPDPAGVVAGAIIGGLLGNAAGHGSGRAGATVAGVIVGGAVGAALTSNLDCEDRSYAYKTYYEGFNSGRSGSRYAWRNPRNDHRGELRIRSYYNDPYGFRCAKFTQATYVQGRSYNARGNACRQPDGTWAIVK